jgi:hypothetical protein
MERDLKYMESLFYGKMERHVCGELERNVCGEVKKAYCTKSQCKSIA